MDHRLGNICLPVFTFTGDLMFPAVDILFAVHINFYKTPDGPYCFFHLHRETAIVEDSSHIALQLLPSAWCLRGEQAHRYDWKSGNLEEESKHFNRRALFI